MASNKEIINFDLYRITTGITLAKDDKLIVRHPRTDGLCVVRVVKIRKNSILVEVVHYKPAGVFWSIKLPDSGQDVHKLVY